MNSNSDTHTHIDKENEDIGGSSLGYTLFKCMKRFSTKILQFVADTEETDTYEQVLTRSIRTALKLKAKGVTRNDVISTCTYNHKNSCVPLVATLFLGAKPANFDPNLSHLDTVHLLKLAQPKIIFVSTESLAFMEKCLKESQVESELVVFGYSRKYSQFSEYLVANLDEANFKPVSVDDSRETAIIMFSSGTTGFPKGICLNHYSFLRQLNNSNLFWKNCDTDQSVWLVYTTFYWISAVILFIRCVACGNATVVCSKFDPVDAWRLIEKYKVTYMFLAPHFANDLLYDRPKNVDVSSLKVFLTGGSPVTKALMDSLRVALPNTNILQGYGQTEMAGAIAIFNPEKNEDVEMQTRKPLSCGKIIDGVTWKVVDPTTDKALGPNQRGELRIKCDFLMNGYYKMDASSAYDAEGYYKTGDVLYYDEEGCFYVVDRIKEIFKYKGWHILPAVLEEILMCHPAVKEAAVIGIPHETDGEHPMGIVVLYDNNDHVTPQEIELFVEGKVSENQRLRAGVKVVNEVLRTATSKLRRNDMKRMVLNGKI